MAAKEFGERSHLSECEAKHMHADISVRIGLEVKRSQKIIILLYSLFRFPNVCMNFLDELLNCIKSVVRVERR